MTNDERAKRIAEAVRDAAAKICDGVNNYDNPMTAMDCADAIRSLDLDAIIASVPGPWQPIETAPKGKSIVVGYFNRNGKWRTVKAEYATEEIIAEWENDDCEPGWYESSEEQEIIYRLEYEPTHWHPLSTAPTEGKP